MMRAMGTGQAAAHSLRPASGDALVDSLVELGLTLNRSRVYVSLLESSPATAVQVADRSGVPRTKIYEALEALEHLGFCSVRAGRVACYEPIAPEIALNEWVRRRDLDRQATAEREDRLRNELVARLPRSEDVRASQEAPFIEVLVGGDQVVQAFEQLLVRAERRLDIVQAPPIFQPRGRWNELEAEAIRRGVHVRVLYAPVVASDPARFGGLIAAGGEGRVSSGLVLKLALRDDDEVMVAVPNTGGGADDFTVILITHADLVAPLQLLFRKEWRRATPLQAA